MFAVEENIEISKLQLMTATMTGMIIAPTLSPSMVGMNMKKGCTLPQRCEDRPKGYWVIYLRIRKVILNR
jgi:hypothetical protein